MFLSRRMCCVITRLDLVFLLLAAPILPFEVFPQGTMVYASITCEQCNNAKQSKAVQWNQLHAARRLLSGSVTAAAPPFMTQAPISLPHENVGVSTPTISLVPPLQAPAATPDPSSDAKTAKPPVPPAVTPATTAVVPDPSPPAVNDPSDGSNTASFPPPAIPVRAENPPAAAAAAAAPVTPVFSLPPVPPPVNPAIPVMDTKPSAPNLSPPAPGSDPVTAKDPPAAAAAPITMAHRSTPPVSPAIAVMDTKPSAPNPSDGSKTPPVASFPPISPTPPVTSIPPVPAAVSPAVIDTKPSAPPPLIVPLASAPPPFKPPLFVPPSSPTELVQPPPSSLVSSAPTTLLQQPPSPSSSAPNQSVSESPAAIPIITPSSAPRTSLLPPPSSSSPPSPSATMPTITPPPTTFFQPPPSSSSSAPTPSTAVMPIVASSSPPMQPPSSSSSPPPIPTAESPAVMPISTPSSAPTTVLQPPPSSPPSLSTAQSPPTTSLQPPPSSPSSPSAAETPAVMPILAPLSAPTTSLQPPPSSPSSAEPPDVTHSSPPTTLLQPAPSPSAAESPALLPILTPSSPPTTLLQPAPSPSAAESPAVMPILTPSSPPTTLLQPPPNPSAAESPAVMPILTPLSSPTISMQQPPSSSASSPSTVESPAERPPLTPSSSPPALMQPPRSSPSPSSPSTVSPAVLTPPSSTPASMQPPTSMSLDPISPSSSSQGPALSPNFESIPPLNSSPLSPEASVLSPLPQMATNPVPAPSISNAPEKSTIPLPPTAPRRTAPAPLPSLQRQPARSPLTSPAEPVSPILSPKASTALAPTPGPSLANAIVPAAAAPVLQGILSPVSVLASPPTARPPQSPAMIFFPPPPNSDCHKQCTDPYVTTLPGGPCDCVIPIRVGLALAVPVYGFLPLVSELAKELAAGTFLLQSQVQIVGANAVVGKDLDNTEVQFSLVPLLQSFDNATAVHIAQRFWTHQVFIDETRFGNYTVLYVIYPGLPPFNPQGSFGTSNGSNGNTFTEQPVGVDIQKRKSPKFAAGIIVVITLTCAIATLLSLGLIWFLVTKCHRYRSHASLLETTVESSITKRSAALLSSSSRSSSLSFASSFAPFTGSVRTFSLSELEKATENFEPANVIGEGGFGRVYYGVLEDQTKIAVKVLIRDDHQGDREFAAEVEMLSRLHHRNLVKLVGICTEDRMRSLVYELIRNGSVDSHLHGADKEIAPLNWEARLKIALGAARALAYLHEDSFPRVIHRDFKSSNILLEEDFTPKVSDFGLAKAASEELTGHISTRVMGTFGYVAPEYAMTGHLLVKSDVYSYGVVLLELLSGRRPVDMSRPPGQENLVTWARPLLTGREGLQILMDPDLEGNVSSENLARVAVIASMCVQPEVSNRPFMSEVVQALKLVWNDTDDGGDEGTTPASDNGYLPRDWDVLSRYRSNSGGAALDRRPLSSSAFLSNSSRLIRQFSGSFSRHSDPERPKTMSEITAYPKVGSVSEHGVNRYKGAHLWS